MLERETIPVRRRVKRGITLCLTENNYCNILQVDQFSQWKKILASELPHATRTGYPQTQMSFQEAPNYSSDKMTSS